MQMLMTGVDDDGRSCVVDRTDIAPTGGETLATLFETSQAPPPARPPGHEDFIDLGVSAGLLRWMLVDFEPGALTPMHHTDSIDLDSIRSGSIELLLDDGAHLLEPGDCVVVAGVDHAWRAGPEGCTMSVVVVGTPPPDAS